MSKCGSIVIAIKPTLNAALFLLVYVTLKQSLSLRSLLFLDRSIFYPRGGLCSKNLSVLIVVCYLIAHSTSIVALD